ncbi:unnamed protein product [Paramecium primaurelia]|uniref:Uncharacterized protein n=1 Tax=Paramecium primaurelia TaxID=5886 RepID=A0A8S1KFC6_PARPR|nr:unnamed protein product [Paramecium primaurelia]
MSQKLQSVNTKVSHLDNFKQIQSLKHHRSHNNLQKHNRAESETLFFQNNQLKSSMSSLNQDLQLQKNKFSQLERFSMLQGTIDNNKTFITMLKEKLKKLELDLFDKIKEIEALKKMSLITKYQELQVELYNYQQLVLIQKQEIIQLKEQIRDQQQLTIEDLYQLQQKTIQNLLIQNHEYSSENAKYKTEKYFYISQIESLKVRLSIKEKEIQKLNNQIKQFENLIKNNCYIQKSRQQIFKESVENAHLSERLQQLQMKYQDDINNKQQQIDDLKQQLIQNEEEKNRLEYIQLDQQDRRSSLMEMEQKQQNSIKNFLNDSDQSQQNKQNCLQSKQQYQKQNIQQIDITKIQKNLDMIDIMDSNLDDRDKYVQTSSRKERKIIRVNFYDVQKFGFEIRFKLLSREISLQNIDDLFSRYDSQIKIHELLDMLLQEPFKIQSYEQRKLIARYLIEDNNEDYIIYDALNSNETSIVLSIFKQLIGKLKMN